MEWFLIIAMLWGGVKALDKGASWAWRSAKDTARQYAAAKPAKPGSAGAKAGRVAASGWFAAVEGARGFGAGWRSGWPEGRQQAYEWRDRRRADKASDGVPATQPDSGKGAGRLLSKQEQLDELNRRVDEERAKAGLPPEERDESGRPITNIPWRDELANRRAEREQSDDSEETDMPEPANPVDDSQRSGEVTNYPQLLEALKRIEQDAADDLEDAQADERRAQQDKAEVDGMVASLARLKLDQGTISAVHEIAEAAQAREEAARGRAQAAEQRTATARNAYETVRRNYEQYYEAATSAPAVPEREFAGTG